MKIIATILVMSFFSGCAKTLILQAPVVSMKKSNVPAGVQLTEGEDVKVTWCQSDKPVVKNDDGTTHYGIIDQAIYKAHQKTKADFFLNNRFYTYKDCVIMQAVAAKTKGGKK